MKRNKDGVKTIFLIFTLISFFLLPVTITAGVTAGVTAGSTAATPGDKKEEKRKNELFQWIDFGYWINDHFMERHSAHMEKRFYTHRAFEFNRKVIESSREMKIDRFYRENNVPPEVATHRIHVPKDGLPTQRLIKITPLELIEDGFKHLGPIFKIGRHLCFSQGGSIQKEHKVFDDSGNLKVERKTYTGIYRLEGDGKYRELNGTVFDYLLDMGNNRVLGYNVSDPFNLYGFRENFEGVISVELPDFQHRVGLHRIGNNRFLFHHFRFSPYSYAVDVYDMKGKRAAQCFNMVPYDYSNAKHGLPLAEATKVTADGNGHFYIAAQYPLNPYRIWKYDENGKLVKVLGNHFIHPDEYELPSEWITEHGDRIRRYGVNRLYTIIQLLNDDRGRLYVVFEYYKMHKEGQLTYEERDPETYMDVYDAAGRFLGRTEFKYGIPDVIVGDRIYARDQVPMDKKIPGKQVWAIRILKLEM